jgi:hypothetical protein
MASIATMTGTLVDSGCKHIIPVRVSMDTLLSLSSETDQNTLLRDKMRFCVHKNDLLLCVNKPLFQEGVGALAKHAAYPHVLSTLGDASWDLKDIIADFYHAPHRYMGASGRFELTAHGFDTLHPNLPDGAKQKLKRLAAHIPRFTFMGFSLGLGYAHPNSGDNVVSSMIGGMITVQNGHFDVCTGDHVMWYFEFEADYFDRDGRRKADPQVTRMDPSAQDRQRMHQRENGNITQGHDKHKGKGCIAYPKPFLAPLYDQHLGSLDRTRVFAKAVSNARAFDKLDLLICTQSI